MLDVTASDAVGVVNAIVLERGIVMAVGEPKIVEVIIMKPTEVVGEVLHTQGPTAKMATQIPASQRPCVFGQFLVHVALLWFKEPVTLWNTHRALKLNLVKIESPQGSLDELVGSPLNLLSRPGVRVDKFFV